MKQYIYGETFLKTNKNLYVIKSYNMIHENKIHNDFYILVKGYFDQRGQTNSFTSIDGNNHIELLRKPENLCFNQIKENTRLYNAIQKRLN